MRQTELQLSPEDRRAVHELRSKGMHRSREVNRAHMLACLDAGLPDAQIIAVLGVGRTALWRTRAAYLQGGLALALFDMARTGRPRTREAAPAARPSSATSRSPGADGRR